MKAVVLHSEIAGGAGQDEQDTLIQVESVGTALRELGYQVTAVPFSLDLAGCSRRLQSVGPDLAFNLVEGVHGSSKLIYLGPLLLEELHIPFAGCGSQAMYLTTDKILTKKLLAGAGLPTALWLERAVEIDPEPGVRYIVKPVAEDASLGIDQKAIMAFSSRADLLRVLEERRARYGGEWFAERFIESREFNLGILSDGPAPALLPPAEINFTSYWEGQHKIVDYKGKWEPDSPEYTESMPTFDLPPGSEPLVERLKEIALECWRLFDLSGFARVDFRIDSAGNPFILEINCNPGIAPDSGYISATRRAGLPYTEVIRRICSDLRRS